MKRSVFLTHWLPLLCWMGLIFLLSHQDKTESNRTSEWLLWILDRLGIDPEVFREQGGRLLLRKLAHFTEYAVLYPLAFRVVVRYVALPRALWMTLLGCAVYAASDEWHQSFVPGRGPTPWDVLIDTCGATCSMLFVWLRRKK
ncbi:MAG: VanZ family protein [Bacteroidia bacterium]